MIGVMWLYITENGGVYKVPNPKKNINNKFEFKAVSKLANADVLLTMLGYEVVNRKPYSMEAISFERVLLDGRGKYPLEKQEDNEMKNFYNYDYSDAEELSKREVIPLPLPPDNIPTTKEKNALYLYLKLKYPMLFEECSYLVEKHIENMKNNYVELKELVKLAYKKKLGNT